MDLPAFLKKIILPGRRIRVKIGAKAARTAGLFEGQKPHDLDIKTCICSRQAVFEESKAY